MIGNIGKFCYLKLLEIYDSRAGNESISFYELNNANVKNASVLSDRESLVKKMPTSGIVAEIGVNKGKFSEMILQLNNPEKLHLIDAWGGLIQVQHQNRRTGQNQVSKTDQKELSRNQ